jgi:hypothetical protein
VSPLLELLELLSYLAIGRLTNRLLSNNTGVNVGF